MRPLHIAFFNRAFHPEESATSQLLTELAESLVRDHGCRVSVVTGIPPKAVGSWANPGGLRLLLREEWQGICILRVRGTRFSKRFFIGRVSNYLSYFTVACFAGLGLNRPDVVIALTDPPTIGLAGWLAARRARCPLVVSFRDIFPEAGRLLREFLRTSARKAACLPRV